ncbi:MAG: hypothetical protein HY951_14420 [Bacteroidia bacterium]|nr:hypothetical protein [Bacteroidia bacterium]
MAEETQYTANTGVAVLNTSNSTLTAVGTLGTNIWKVIDAAASPSKGLIIKTITLKAQTDTTQSMVRLFINNGSGSTGDAYNKLISEIEIPAVIKSATSPAFEITIPVDYALLANDELWATFEFASGSPSINVIAEGMDWNYYSAAVRPESSNYTANTGMDTITAANTNLTGAGTQGTDIWNIITATAGKNGTQIQSVTVKSKLTATTSAGMVRLFLNDGSGDGTTHNFLLTEIPVEATIQSGTAHSFSRRIDFSGKGFFLKSGWKLRATTETNDDFNIIAEGLDLTYPA